MTQASMRVTSLVVAALVILTVSAGASPSQRLVKSPPHKLQSIEPPPGWEVAPSPPSSRLLATWSHREGARLTLAAEPVAQAMDAGQLFERSRASLERQGWVLGKITRPSGKGTRVTVDAALDKGKRSARQLYLVEDGFAYVLTLVAPSEQLPARQLELDDTIASMRLGSDEN